MSDPHGALTDVPSDRAPPSPAAQNVPPVMIRRHEFAAPARAGGETDGIKRYPLRTRALIIVGLVGLLWAAIWFGLRAAWLGLGLG